MLIILAIFSILGGSVLFCKHVLYQMHVLQIDLEYHQKGIEKITEERRRKAHEIG